MSRYYAIFLTRDDGSLIKGYTSRKADGSTDYSALKIEFDIAVTTYGIPKDLVHVKISGVNFADIQQASDLATSNGANPPRGANFTLLGGMSKGLPLANPSQAGVLATGLVQQCWGNNQGREVSLEMLVAAKPYTRDNPANLAFTWYKGETLQAMVTRTLTTAYPGATITGSFSSTLVYPEDQPGFCQTLQQFSAYVLAASQSIIQVDGYVGAQIQPTPAGFNIFDGSSLPAVKQIGFLDLIGQPTWIDAATMQLRLVLRADLSVGDLILMPSKSIAVNTVNNYAQARNKAAFQGQFQINNIRHVGDSRQASADSWVTIVEASSQIPVIPA